MKGFVGLVIVALTLSTFAVYKYTNHHKISEYSHHLLKIAEEVNAKKTTWTAGHNHRFENQTKESVQKLLIQSEIFQTKRAPQVWFEEQAKTLAGVKAPDAFDSRTNWDKCDSIKEIRDQSACGSCWAFGAVEAMSDRLCITSGQKDQRRISAEDLMECCWYCGMGCNGGFPSMAWHFLSSTGITTGGLYGDKSTCKPYKFAPCAHHVTSKDYQPCPSDEYKTPSCSKTCENGADYTKDKIKAKRTYSVAGAENIAKEVSTSGPVETTLTVYEDLLTYKTGVYQHTTGSQLGGHAVRLIGYGTEAGTPYWIITNSWNAEWGDKGTFKIKRGGNECGIESEVYGAEF